MCIDHKICRFPVVIALITAALHTLPSAAFAECKEFEIVEYEDRVEAVCVGEPLTPAQKKAMADEEKRQELEYRRQKAEEDRRQREIDAANARTKSQSDAERKRLESKPPTPKTDSKPQNKPSDNQIQFNR